jgi:hypothetical protein
MAMLKVVSSSVTPPANPEEGTYYYNEATGYGMVYDGAEWLRFHAPGEPDSLPDVPPVAEEIPVASVVAIIDDLLTQEGAGCERVWW